MRFHTILTRGVSHCGLAIYIKKSILRQKKKNYGNSNISPCKDIIFKKLLSKKPKSFSVSKLKKTTTELTTMVS
jgi:hypothetical protein